VQPVCPGPRLNYLENQPRGRVVFCPWLTDIGDRCVPIDSRISGTQIFVTSLGGDDTIQFDQKVASDLRSGQMANVFGNSDNAGCLKAVTIIYEVEGPTIPVQPLP